MDDSFYYALNPSAMPQGQRRSSISKHRRKQSMLEKPTSNGGVADNDQVDPPDAVIEEEEPSGPPEATLKRRAQSYTDFHHAARAVLREGEQLNGGGLQNRGLDVVKGEKEKLGISDDIGFAEWYECLEHDLLESSHDEYTNYQRQLELSESHLQTLQSETNSALDLLGSLTRSFKDVEAQTMNFQKQCEGLLKEQQRIEGLADDLDHNLKFYNYLEPVTRRLNAPGAGSFVRSQDFSEMLARIDDCLEYMTEHPNHRESATYLSRYRLLMTRGLTLIRVNFVGGLRDIASDVSKRIADGQLKETTMSALLYAKFRVGAAELKAEAQEIRKRAIPPPGAEPGSEAEYQNLMNELYTSYSATRGKLIIPMARKKIADIAIAPSTSKDLVSFARSSIGYTRGICSDEYELWREWFEGENGMYDFLESVCEPMYDHLRPRIIHETQLVKLCELCTLLQMRYMHDPDEEAEPVDANQLDFSYLIQPALEDCQTRLVFRTQAILRDEIERYKPKKEELDYPARNRQVSLSGTKSGGPVALSGRKGSITEPVTPKAPQVVEESDSPNARWGLETEAALEGWYPTLRKAIWLLSRIYRLVNSTVFDSLAHTILHSTTLSLLHASHSIPTPAPNPSLFLLKHLLLLKSHLLAFDFESTHPAPRNPTLDFSPLTATLYSLSLFDPASLWRLITSDPRGLVPRVVENLVDARAELDGRLRGVINDVVAFYAGVITREISGEKVGGKGFEALAAVGKVKEAAEREVPVLRRGLESYIADERTREMLVAAVREKVVGEYEGFYDLWAERRGGKGGGDGGGGHKSKKGKGREGEVWDVDVFQEWVGGVFGVRGLGLVGLEGGEEEGGWGGSRGGSL